MMHELLDVSLFSSCFLGLRTQFPSRILTGSRHHPFSLNPIAHTTHTMLALVPLTVLYLDAV